MCMCVSVYLFLLSAGMVFNLLFVVISLLAFQPS